MHCYNKNIDYSHFKVLVISEETRGLKKGKSFIFDVWPWEIMVNNSHISDLISPRESKAPKATQIPSVKSNNTVPSLTK